MANWLQKVIASNLPVQRTRNLPSTDVKDVVPTPQNLPNATVIYGIGASMMFVGSFFLLIGGRWFPALVVFALGVCLAGFALHLLKHQD